MRIKILSAKERLAVCLRQHLCPTIVVIRNEGQTARSTAVCNGTQRNAFDSQACSTTRRKVEKQDKI